MNRPYPGCGMVGIGRHGPSPLLTADRPAGRCLQAERRGGGERVAGQASLVK